MKDMFTAALRSWNLKHRLTKRSSLYPGPFNFFLISEHPLLILTFTMNNLKHVASMLRDLDGRPVHFFVGFWWHMSNPRHSHSFGKELRQLWNRYPNASFTLLCNSMNEKKNLDKATKLNSALVSPNSFLDENIFNLTPKTEKEYDALYTGRLASYKRIELAKDVESLAIITAPGNDTEYGKKIRKSLPHANWVNYRADDSYVRISQHSMPEWINKAKVGLILSAQEGACYAATEYLLCGIPVVSTRSRGGRDEFFTDDTTLYVEAEPSAVARGVKRAIETCVSPERVREATLDIVHKHRARFFCEVNEVWRKSGISKDLRDNWENIFINKLHIKCAPSDFQELLSEKQFREKATARDRSR